MELLQTAWDNYTSSKDFKLAPFQATFAQRRGKILYVKLHDNGDYTLVEVDNLILSDDSYLEVPALSEEKLISGLSQLLRGKFDNNWKAICFGQVSQIYCFGLYREAQLRLGWAFFILLSAAFVLVV